MREMGRKGGTKGGKRRMETMTAEQRTAIPKKAAAKSAEFGSGGGEETEWEGRTPKPPAQWVPLLLTHTLTCSYTCVITEAKSKVRISERALMQRLNRKLKSEGQILRTARWISDGPLMHEDSNLGRYYAIDL